MFRQIKINQLKMGVILSYFYMIIGYVISIVYTPIILQFLGQDQYGLYNLVISIVNYLSLLNFGLGSAYIRFYSMFKVDNKDVEIAKLNGMFAIVFACISMISIVLGIILMNNIGGLLSSQISPEDINLAKVLMAILIVNMAISFPDIVFSSYITVNEKFLFQKLTQLIKVVAIPMFTIPILHLGYASVGLVIVTTIFNLIIVLSNIIFCFKVLKIKFMFRNLNFQLLGSTFVFSFYIFLNMIIDQINWNVDKFIIARYKGLASVAIYGIAAQINAYYVALSSTISSVFVPRVNRMVSTNSSKSALTDMFVKIGRIQFMLLSFILLGFIFLGKYFIYIWVGDTYKDAYYIILLLIIPVSIPLIQNIGIEIQKAKNKHQFRAIVYFLIAIMNVCLSIPLVKIYGAIGAAMGTALALFIGQGLVMNVYYQKAIDIDVIYFWKKILSIVPSLLPSIIAGIWWINSNHIKNIKQFLLFGFIFSISFLLPLAKYGMNDFERGHILKPFHKLGGTIVAYFRK